MGDELSYSIRWGGAQSMKFVIILNIPIAIIK